MNETIGPNGLTRAQAEREIERLREYERQHGLRSNEIGKLRAALKEAEAERDRLRKLFDDAGGGEYNVLALIDYYQRSSMEADDRVAELRLAHAETRAEALEAQMALQGVLELLPIGESSQAIAFAGHHGEYVRAVVDAICSERDVKIAEATARAERADARAEEAIRQAERADALRAALRDVEAGEVSYGRLVEVMRAAVETEIARREKKG